MVTLFHYMVTSSRQAGVFSSCCLALDSSSSFPCPAFRAIAKSVTAILCLSSCALLMLLSFEMHTVTLMYAVTLPCGPLGAGWILSIFLSDRGQIGAQGTFVEVEDEAPFLLYNPMLWFRSPVPCVEPWAQWYYWEMLISVALGQVLSLLVCGIGLTSKYLAEDFHANTPVFQSFLNYILLFLVYTTTLAVRQENNACAIKTVCKNSMLQIISVLQMKTVETESKRAAKNSPIYVPIEVSAILSLGYPRMPTLENPSSFTSANDVYSLKLGENKSQKDLQLLLYWPFLSSRGSKTKLAPVGIK
ncbi:hypothetical protein STEG23_023655, partial [Scotinomys teguina]